MMHPDTDYYTLLGVTSTATPEEIIKAYRKKILEVHLDKLTPGQDADLCYKTIEAYRVLSNRKLRAKYDIQRDPSYKAKEKFVPAGYLCYDVGQSQLSKRMLKNISDWKDEFDEIKKQGDGISDNYFECFSSLMGQVLETEDQQCAKSLNKSDEEFSCSACDKKFPSEAHHWDQIIQPYITMFAGDNQGGVAPLLAYFEKLLGSTHFTWEPRSFPTTILGMWGSEEWKKMENCDVIIARILESLPDEDEFTDTDELVDYIGETFLSDSESDPVLYPKKACHALIFILENQEEQSAVVNRVQECLFRDEIQEILYLTCAMKNYLGCNQEEWLQLAKEAVANEQPEMAMLWTKVVTEFYREENNEALEGIWYNLGMKLHKIDPVLAHFCFMSQGYGEDEETAQEDWTDLGDDFCNKQEHHAAIEYYLHANLKSKPKRKSTNNNESDSDGEEEEQDPLEKLLDNSKLQIKKGNRVGAATYRGIYYSLKSKSLLSKLQRRRRDDAESELDGELYELIELIDELDTTNPLEGYRLIAASWPRAFESPVCQGIHKGTIAFLRRGKLTTTAFNLILGALHFLPEEEEEDEESFEKLQRELCDECNQMVVRQTLHSMKTSDFNALTDILLFISSTAESHCLSGIKRVLDQIGKEEQRGMMDTSKSPHLRAMKFLMEGTVAKINKEWMNAMNLYQNALLSSPECMHRVLPSISKLSQDIEFHEAILSQVHSEVKELKECFELQKYPEVESFNSKTNRNSLVIGDVVPKMDFGYKNNISKIQPDPDKVVIQPPPEENEEDEPQSIETNTPLVTLDKTEEAIGSGKNQGQLNAALSYIDLIKALPLAFQPGPIVMAASHFLRAMDETTDTSNLFAYRNAIMQLAENLLKIDRKTQASIQHGLTHKHMLSVLLSAHEKLSKSVQRKEFTEGSEENKANENETDSDDDEDQKEKSAEDEEGPNLPKQQKKNKKGKKNKDKLDSEKSDSQDEVIESSQEDTNENSNDTEASVTIKLQRSESSIKKAAGMDLIKTSDAHLISKFLKNVVNFPKIEPLANIPTLNCSDLVYVETLGNSFLSQFCNEKAEQKYHSRKIPKHLHSYIHFVEVWKGRSQLSDFQTAKLKAMEELLALKGWNLEDVEQIMRFPVLNLTDDGWSSEYRTELDFPNPPKAFRSIHGFKIDYKLGRISLLLSRDQHTAYTSGNLFDTRDINEIFNNGLEPSECLLSLDSPDLNLRSHPFKEAKFSTSNKDCKSFHAPNLFLTLTRAAMMLCYLCSGLEICAKSPFNMKPSDEGLLLRLEEHLQHILRPSKARKNEDEQSKIRQPELDIPNRFWLNVTEVFEEEEEDELNSLFTYKVGDVKAEVKINTLILTLSGSKASLAPEAEFARDVSKNFDEIGEFYPELLRLKELVKLTVICKKLKEILREKTTILKQNERGKEDQMRIACVCKSIRDLGIYLEEDEEKCNNLAATFTKCTWVPATFCNNFDPEIYEVSAGVRINPQITYFPVTIPSDCKSVNAKELLAKKKASFIRR